MPYIELVKSCMELVISSLEHIVNESKEVVLVQFSYRIALWSWYGSMELLNNSTEVVKSYGASKQPYGGCM